MSKSSVTSPAVAPSPRAIEVRVAELRQLFSTMDPSPFHERDIDPRAEEFIVDWSRDLPAGSPLALVVHVERPVEGPDETAIVRDAIHEFFSQRAASTRRTLRELFRRGRISLVIALAFLALSIVVSDSLASYLGASHLVEVMRQGLLIGGWVAMWRPLEVFLYDWWPIRADMRLFDRLSAMSVTIAYGDTRTQPAHPPATPERPTA
ncbi:MAG: hypothetical protein ABL961_02715 [Vicinamibacterales bacterium]